MKWLLYVYSLTRGVLLGAIFLALIHVFVGSIFLVSGESMEPALQSGDLLWVNKIAYLTTGPKRGDIVILKYPGDPDKRKFVKRIVGLPGETVQIKKGEIFVNGDALTEAYLPVGVQTEPNIAEKLKDDVFYTLGDNRLNSSDSRVFGGTPRRFLIGRAKFRLWPLSRFGYLAEVFY